MHDEVNAYLRFGSYSLLWECLEIVLVLGSCVWSLSEFTSPRKLLDSEHNEDMYGFLHFESPTLPFPLHDIM